MINIAPHKSIETGKLKSPKLASDRSARIQTNNPSIVGRLLCEAVFQGSIFYNNAPIASENPQDHEKSSFQSTKNGY